MLVPFTYFFKRFAILSFCHFVILSCYAFGLFWVTNWVFFAEVINFDQFWWSRVRQGCGTPYLRLDHYVRNKKCLLWWNYDILTRIDATKHRLLPISVFCRLSSFKISFDQWKKVRSNISILQNILKACGKYLIDIWQSWII